jgi:hypothetical protein
VYNGDPKNYSKNDPNNIHNLPVLGTDHFEEQNSNAHSFVLKNTSHTIEKMPSSYVLEAVTGLSLFNPSQQYFKLRNSLLHHLIQANDVVFIRLEKLEIDAEQYSDNLMGYSIIDSNALKGRVFDMIGLVDGNPISLDGKTNKQTIVLNGRDLSKLLIDDSVLFFPIEYAVKDTEQIIKNSKGRKSAGRLTIKLPPGGNYSNNITHNVGAIVSDSHFNFDVTQTLEDWLLFIFQQLTNIAVCPNNLFNAYPDKTFIISRDEKFNADGSFGYKRILADGIWQAVKLVMDKNISERRINDSSLSTDTGSLLNLIRKVCQDPFAEFTSDTYGDKFYFILRKPPFNQNAFKSNKCINIFDGDVLSTNLNFSTEVYSFFRLTPMGSLVDTSDGKLMMEIPAILLPEFADIWGTKSLDVQTSYIDFDNSISADTAGLTDNILKQAKEDLDWLIETHCYLPFTRMGNITIKNDRTIKRGMCIRLFSTGEIYHVDSVTNVRDFTKGTTALTTLTLSRGIVEKHFDKYFSIVNLQRNSTNKDTVWTVNKDIFDFFINRKQFS